MNNREAQKIADQMKEASGVKKKPKAKMKADDRHRLRMRILNFARDHNLLINPVVGADFYIDSYWEFVACPCDRTRPLCPCEQAMGEIEEIGRCKCRLLWKDMDTFTSIHLNATEEEQLGES